MPYLFLLPAFLYFAAFFFYPIFSNFWISLHQGDVLTGGGRFVGMQNYAQLAHDTRFRSSAWTTAAFVFVTLVLSTVAGLGLALILNREMRFRTAFRAVLLFPFMTSMVIVSLIMLQIAEAKFRRLNAPELMKQVHIGVEYVDGSKSRYAGRRLPPDPFTHLSAGPRIGSRI